METKVCKQCGELKPIELYRKYYGGRKGTYKTCKSCEKINSREKYLAKKDGLTPLEQMELDKIHQLWDVQRAAGLQPPRTIKVTTSLVDSLDDLLSKYTQPVSAVVTGAEVPHELTRWLTCELTDEPDYYLEDVYEALKKKYRPIIKIDEDMLPVSDDTYKDVLEQILTRFYDYEDNYYI